MYIYIYIRILLNIIKFSDYVSKTRLDEYKILAKTRFLLSSMVSSYGRLKFD